MATAAARPRYGGVLRIETAAQVRAVDPAAPGTDPAEAAARRRLLALTFETLVAPDAAGGLRPMLAVDWESDAHAVRWRFRLRAGVTRHDGAPLDARQVAAVLGARPGPWKVSATADAIVFDCDRPTPDLPWALADLRYAVVFAQPAGEPTGTGPFAIDRRAAGRLVLRAHEAHWAGRPFVDAIEIRMGRPAADQVVSLEVGRADIVDVRPQDVRRVSQRAKVVASRPTDLIALVFAGPRQAAASEPLRRALALSLDRDSLCHVLLQRQGQPAATLLPRWLSGYAALIGAERDRSRARALVNAMPVSQRSLTLGVDRQDPLLLAVAERVAVDAREVGLVIGIDAGGLAVPRPPDLRLVRAGLQATSPDRALADLTRVLGLQPDDRADAAASPQSTAALGTVYLRERALLDGFGVLPLVHLPQLHGVGPKVDAPGDTRFLPSGAWDIASVWLRPDTP